MWCAIGDTAILVRGLKSEGVAAVADQAPLVSLQALLDAAFREVLQVAIYFMRAASLTAFVAEDKRIQTPDRSRSRFTMCGLQSWMLSLVCRHV